MAEDSCRNCDEPVRPRGRRGPPAKYCSDTCKAQHSKARTGYVYAPRSSIHVIDCAICGAAYTSRRANRSSCDRAECVAADKKRQLDELIADWGGDGCPLFNPDKPTSGYYRHVRGGQEPCEQCRAGFNRRQQTYRRATNRRGERTTITCEWCNEHKSVRRRYGRPQRWCSLECRRAHEADVRSTRYALVHVGPSAPRSDLPRLHPARRYQPKMVNAWAKVFVQGPCAWCGDVFCSGATSVGTAPRYCSRACSRRSGRRRQGRFQVPDRVRQAIYERDGWKCQLCGKRVGKKYHPSHERAPTLDHIIPQSVGGSDDPSNLQLAHRICNSIKNATVWQDGEQLRLVG